MTCNYKKLIENLIPDVSYGYKSQTPIISLFMWQSQAHRCCKQEL